MKILEDWHAHINTSNERTSTHRVSSWWIPPECGWLKCNVDASLFKEVGKIGFGLILRDDQANFLAAKGGLLTCTFDPGIAEAYACKEAIKWIQSKGLSKVIIESDCLEVVKAIQRKVNIHSYVGRVISDCQTLKDFTSDAFFSFTKREANVSAHKIARFTKSEAGIGEWINQPPDCIVTIFDQ